MKQKLLSILMLCTLLVGVAFAQNKTITGKVTSSDNGETLPGVSVVVQGTTVGTQTGPDGEFSLSIPANANSLEFTYVGFIKQVIQIGNRSSFNVALVSDASELGEVVITGYGNTTTLRQTGAVSTVSAEEVENVPFTSVDKALQGRVAGLQSVGASGQPGAMQQIRIRGLGSISGSSEPLYVIDGVPVNSGDLSRNTTTANALAGINPNDIESISVLKDASSTAIYGSRGSNGVVLITTKSGKAGKTRVRLDAEYGSVTPGVFNDRTRPLTTAENIMLIGEALLNNPTYVNAYSLTPENIREFVVGENGFDINEDVSTDWYDEVTKRGNHQQYNLSFDGGNEMTQFHVGAGVFKQDGTVESSKFSRYSGNINLKHKIDEKLSVGTNLILSTANQQGVLNAGAFGNPVLGSLFLMPDLAARNDDGTPNISGALAPGAGLYNPLEILSKDQSINNTQKVIGSVNAEYKILPNLKFSTKYGIDYNNLEEDYYNNPSYGDGRNVGGRSYRYYTRYFNWVWTNLLDYRWDIDDNNDWVANIKAGYEAQKSEYYSSNVAVNNMPLNTDLTDPSVGATPTTASGSRDSYAFASILALGDISYQNKYVLSGSFRRDGSSRFGIGNQYGNFWSVGGSWNMDREDFIRDIEWISQLKLRASYGLTGNAEIGNNPWRNLYGYTRGTYNWVYNGQVGSGPSQFGLSTLTWEKTNMFDFALDFGLFNNRLGATVEFYNKESDGLLLSVPVSYTTGFASYIDNYGGLRNRGLEVELRGTPIQTEDFQWDLAFNISLNKNTTTHLVADEQVSSPFIRKVGEDYFSFYLPQYAGVNPETGMPQWYKDETRTEVVTSHGQAERVLLGKSALPKAFGSLSTTLNYKGFGLDALLYYNFGNHIYNGFFQYQNSGGAYIGSYNQAATELERWQQPGDITQVPKLVYGSGTNSYAVSDRLLYSGDFIRLRDVTLSYTLPSLLVEQAKLSNVRIYVRGSNLFTWVADDRLPFDPEAGGAGGTNNFELFIPKTVTVGLNIGF